MNLPFQEYEPLAPYTAWRIGGPARWFINATSSDMLISAYLWALQHQVPVFVLGGGSNLLMSDQGWPGLVIRYRSQHQILNATGDQALLTADAGIPMAGTARKLAAQGWAGLQWAEGLPGTLGGAIYGNAGCYGSDTQAVLQSAMLLLSDGSQILWTPQDFDFGYRTSKLKQLHVAGQSWPLVLSATLKLQEADPEQLAQEISTIAATRKSKTPSGSSCGSVFKNPPGTTAGILIDQAGLKGLQVGGAQVAEKHANYILNTGGATAADVLRLAEQVQQEVLRQMGIELELEVRVIGEQFHNHSHIG